MELSKRQEPIAVVIRRKRKCSGNEENYISGEAKRKRAKAADNILNHINSKDNKAKTIFRKWLYKCMHNTNVENVTEICRKHHVHVDVICSSSTYDHLRK